MNEQQSMESLCPDAGRVLYADEFRIVRSPSWLPIWPFWAKQAAYWALRAIAQAVA